MSRFPDVKHPSGFFANHRLALIAGGVAMLASALIVRRKVGRAEREHPPLGKIVEIDGVRLHYVERGQGQPIVLLHGNGSMAEGMELSGLIDMLASRYRVIAFDRPGFGYSERPQGRLWTPDAQADLLHSAFQKLRIERPVVVAHSMATQVAISMALKHPYTVRSMVLLSGYYYPSVLIDVPFLAAPAIPLLGHVMRHTISPLLGRLMWPLLMRRIFRPGAIPARFADAFPVWLALRPSQLRASAAETAFMIPAAARLRRHYRELTMPIVIVAGDGDRLVDTQYQSVRLQQDLPHSLLQIVPGAGHMVHYAVPDQVLSAIDAAVDGAELDEAESITVMPEIEPKPATEYIQRGRLH